MKQRKRRMPGFTQLGGYAAGVAATGTGVGMLETGLGTGTTMGADMMTGLSKPIGPVANIMGTGMVLKQIGKLKNPMRVKRRR